VIQTISLLFHHANIHVGRRYLPYYLEVEAADTQTLTTQIQHIVQHPPSALALADLVPLPEQAQGKYDRYVPDDLVSAAYAADQLDLDGALGALRGVVDTSVGAAQKLE
jgi:hypothetical protein